MATSLYKYLTLMATGTETDNWGNVQNSEQIEIIDRNLGGIVSKSLTNVNVTLTGEESEAAILYLVGTLTGNVQITTQCQGFFFVDNQTTGAFSVTVKNALVATAATLPQGSRVTVISDASNGCRIAGTSDFPSGTRMSFNQTAAPTGWTKDTNAAFNDAAIRLTTGSVSTGGTLAFSSAFTSRPILQANLPNVTFPNTISLDGSQAGGLVRALSGSSVAVQGGTTRTILDINEINTTTLSLSGGVTSGGSGTGLDFAVKYIDFIVAVKN